MQVHCYKNPIGLTTISGAVLGMIWSQPDINAICTVWQYFQDTLFCQKYLLVFATHTIIPPPPNFTLGTMQSDKNCSPGNRQTQTRPSDCQMEKRDLSLQRTRLRFVAELLSFPIVSTLLWYHWQLTVEYLGARKFHDWTCCTGGILSQYHAGIHWAPESDPFFHKCL